MICPHCHQNIESEATTCPLCKQELPHPTYLGTRLRQGGIVGKLFELDEVEDELIKESALTQSDQADEKKKTLLPKLFLQLLWAVLFGYTGIPALFRSTKGYGTYQVMLFVISLILTITVRFWFFFIVIGIQYFFDCATIAARVIIYMRGKKYVKKKEKAQQEM